MTFSPEQYDRLHTLEGRIHYSGLSIEERKWAIAEIGRLGEDAEPVLLAMSVGQWFEPLPGELMDEATRWVERLRKPTRQHQHRRERKKSGPR